MDKEIVASDVILSMGAGIANLIPDSPPSKPDIQVEDLIIGAAVVTGSVKLNPAHPRCHDFFIATAGSFRGW